jgi:hypothetical protein
VAEDRVVLSMTDALELDLVWCKCGHRPNNHFEWGKRPCAHCNCKQFRMELSRGELIKEPTHG